MMEKEAAKSQAWHADRRILPSSSQNTHKHTLEYAGVKKQPLKKFD